MAQQRRMLMPPPPPRRYSAPSRGHEAARAMRDAEMGDVLVLEHHQVCGLVTNHDIVVRMVAAAQDPATTTLADLCRRAFVTVSPTDSVEQAVRLLRTQAIRRVPVVDGGQPVGMGSLGDRAVEGDPDSALRKRSGAPPSAEPGADPHHCHASCVGGTCRGEAYGRNAGRDPGGRTTNWAGTGP
jgi:CBS domain